MIIPNLCNDQKCEHFRDYSENHCGKLMIGHVKNCHKIKDFLVDCLTDHIERLSAKDCEFCEHVYMSACHGCLNGENWKHNKIDALDIFEGERKG